MHLLTYLLTYGSDNGVESIIQSIYTALFTRMYTIWCRRFKTANNKILSANSTLLCLEFENKFMIFALF